MKVTSRSDPSSRRVRSSERRKSRVATSPIAMLLAGPIVQGLFEPWLQPGGWLAGSVGRIIGVGPGRGIGFFFILLGVATVIGVIIARRSRPLMEVETALPDVLTKDPTP